MPITMKHVKLFEDFLNESVLNEIGEGGKAFPWKFIGYNGQEMEFNYTFQSPSNEYGLIFRWMESERSWDCAFGKKTGTRTYAMDISTLTGDGVFPIMATLIEIFDDFLEVTGPKYEDEWNKPNSTSTFITLNRISFTPEKAGKDDDRRLKLYMAYIKKQMPGARVVIGTQQSKDEIIIEV